MLRYTEHRLKDDEKPKNVYEYWVTGSGNFPLDMLRFDGCWPADGDSAAMLIPMNHKDLRSIKLRSYKAPTLERWASFVWSVGRHARVEINNV